MLYLAIIIIFTHHCRWVPKVVLNLQHPPGGSKYVLQEKTCGMSLQGLIIIYTGIYAQSRENFLQKSQNSIYAQQYRCSTKNQKFQSRFPLEILHCSVRNPKNFAPAAQKQYICPTVQGVPELASPLP